jgi:SurA N-terminal domain
VSRRAAALAAAVAAGCVAVSACSSVQMGAAAIAGSNRISSATLTTASANLSAAYQADKAKKVSPQAAVGQATQQALTWLIRFQIGDRVAQQHGINVTPAQVDKEFSALSSAARSNKVTVAEYVSVLYALPPDLVPQFGRYAAILSTLESRITGGKVPSTQAGQTQLANAVGHQQCLASKSLGVSVNPQFGEFDYTTFTVVPAPPTLAAGPGPSKAAAVQVTPPC